MARPATEYRNEVKSRLRDDAFAAVQCAMRLYECSESRAVAILVERGAFGMVGRMWWHGFVRAAGGFMWRARRF